MSKRFLLVLVLFLVVILLGKGIFAQYDNPGDDWSSTTTVAESEEQPTEDEGWVYGGVAGEEGEYDDYDPQTSPGFSLYMEMRIYCHLQDRDSGNKFLTNDYFTKYGHIFMDDYTHTEDLPSFLPYDSDYSSITTLFEETIEDSEKYFVWKGQPSLSIPITSTEQFDNAKLHRFEGKPEEDTAEWYESGCIPYLGMLNILNFTSEDWFGFDSESNLLLHSSENKPIIYGYSYPTKGFDIEWDGTQTDCEVIGGTWYDGTGYNNYNCCGDDRIWLYNKAINEEDGLEAPKIDDDDLEDIEDEKITLGSFCLYGTGDMDEPENNEIGFGVLEEDGSYTCSQTDFEAYDESLELDDEYESLEKPEQETPFVFQGTDETDTETDIGKWSDSFGKNPQFCYYEYDKSTVGEHYQWLDINTIGDKPVNDNGEEITDFANNADETICEKYLAGTWTGSHCCGNKYDYEGQFGDIGYYDESYSEATPIYYTDGQTVLHQYACLQANAYENYNKGVTAQYHKDDGTDVELLNVNGIWYGCNVEDISSLGVDYYKVKQGELTQTLLTDETNADKCAVIDNTYLCNYNYTDTSNPHWDWYHVTSGDEGKYVKETLGYSSSSDTFAYSEPPWLADGQQQGACCAANRCWDGEKCVDEYTEYSYDADSDGEEDTVSICYQSDWSTAETKYDWFHNTDAAAVDYCPASYSCVCSSNEEDDTFCTENTNYLVDGCTITEDFYTNDHLCEAIESGSRWTSRTKFLAFQLLDIAESSGTDFTLFCDNYINTLNNWVDVEPIEDKLNSFCVLLQNEQVTIGVTFNSDNTDEPMEVDADDLLFQGSNAFITDILGNDIIDDCDFAIEHEQTERFGEYYSCDGSTTNAWYNNKLNILIYSKDGLDYTTKLAYMDTEHWQEIFDGYKEGIIGHLSTETIINPAGDDITQNLEAMNYVEDYDRIYYAKNSDTNIFGFEEIKYNGETGNRYYLGVIYDNIAIDCSQVYAPYESAWNIYCNNAGVVLERSTEGSEYWASLTAALRFE